MVKHDASCSLRWCTNAMVQLWCISCSGWCNAHVSDTMHMNLCNAPDDALCRGAHIMVHNGAYGHGAHVMVHMRCCIWYGAHGMMHRAWCIWHDALMMMHLTWRAFHDAHAMMHRMMLVHGYGKVLSMHISTMHNLLHASCSNCFINLSKNEKARLQGYGYVCAARLISRAFLNHSPSTDRSFWFRPSKIFLFPS